MQWFQIDDHVTGGDIIGSVKENDLVLHKIMIPPKAMGKITYLAPEGNYNLTVSYLIPQTISCCSLVCPGRYF